MASLDGLSTQPLAPPVPAPAPVYADMKLVEPPARPLVNEIERSLLCPGCLSCCLSIFPPAWLGACHTLSERQEFVMLNWGKYMGTVREPGCFCANPCGVTFFSISTAREALDLLHVKVADGKGNPLVLSGVVTFQVVDSRKAALEVKSVREYVSTQGMTVMKRIASMYPYEAKDGQPSLKTEMGHLRSQMVQLLQERVNAAGVCVLNFELTDLAYAPEIAQAMLIRQQAEAMVDARKIIVDGAVQIATGAVGHLGERGVHLTKEEEVRLVSNLLTVISAHSGVQPTVNVNSAARNNEGH